MLNRNSVASHRKNRSLTYHWLLPTPMHTGLTDCAYYFDNSFTNPTTWRHIFWTSLSIWIYQSQVFHLDSLSFNGVGLFLIITVVRSMVSGLVFLYNCDIHILLIGGWLDEIFLSDVVFLFFSIFLTLLFRLFKEERWARLIIIVYSSRTIVVCMALCLCE